MRAMSKRRRAGIATRADVRAAVFARDRWRCQLAEGDPNPQCGGPLTPHHRRKASAAGAYIEENLVTLCVLHNEAVENEPEQYRTRFGAWLVVREGDPEWVELGVRAVREAS